MVGFVNIICHRSIGLTITQMWEFSFQCSIDKIWMIFTLRIFISFWNGNIILVWIDWMQNSHPLLANNLIILSLLSAVTHSTSMQKMFWMQDIWETIHKEIWQISLCCVHSILLFCCMECNNKIFIFPLFTFHLLLQNW